MRSPLAGVALAVAVMTLTAMAQPSTGTLAQLAPGQSVGRAPGIPTVPNLRDVSGYKTADGATVARGLAYRSETFSRMSLQFEKYKVTV